MWKRKTPVIPIEETIFREICPELVGWRSFRIEYGGVNEMSLWTGSILVPPIVGGKDITRFLRGKSVRKLRPPENRDKEKVQLFIKDEGEYVDKEDIPDMKYVEIEYCGQGEEKRKYWARFGISWRIPRGHIQETFDKWQER